MEFVFKPLFGGLENAEGTDQSTWRHGGPGARYCLRGDVYSYPHHLQRCIRNNVQ